MPWRRRSASISFRTVACTETSSEAVGSSSTRRRGSEISARAMPTRACWPPESWCGRRCKKLGRKADLGGDSTLLPVVVACPRRRRPRPIAILRAIEKAGLRASSAFWKTSWMARRAGSRGEARRGDRADVAALEADGAARRRRRGGRRGGQGSTCPSRFRRRCRGCRLSSRMKSTPSTRVQQATAADRKAPCCSPFASSSRGHSGTQQATRVPRGIGGRTAAIPATARLGALAALGEAAGRRIVGEVRAGCRRWPRARRRWLRRPASRRSAPPNRDDAARAKRISVGASSTIWPACMTTMRSA